MDNLRPIYVVPAQAGVILYGFYTINSRLSSPRTGGGDPNLDLVKEYLGM